MTTDNKILAYEVLPDSNGGFTACPALLTEAEAIRYLRLDGQKADAAKTLQYYRSKQKLKATKIGKNLLYWRVELDRFIGEMTY